MKEDAEPLPPAPKGLPRRCDAFRHWRHGTIYVVTGVSRSESRPWEFNVDYLPEGVSDETEIPWRRTYEEFSEFVFPESQENPHCPRSVRRFDPIGRREIPTFCRPKVLAFARAMEEKLRKNEHKGGWEGEDPYDLLARIVDETDELDTALEAHLGDKCNEETTRKVLSEAADVANFCLFVADVTGALGEKPVYVGG